MFGEGKKMWNEGNIEVLETLMVRKADGIRKACMDWDWVQRAIVVFSPQKTSKTQENSTKTLQTVETFLPIAKHTTTICPRLPIY